MMRHKASNPLIDIPIHAIIQQSNYLSYNGAYPHPQTSFSIFWTSSCTWIGVTCMSSVFSWNSFASTLTQQSTFIFFWARRLLVSTEVNAFCHLAMQTLAPGSSFWNMRTVDNYGGNSNCGYGGQIWHNWGRSWNMTGPRTFFGWGVILTVT